MVRIIIISLCLIVNLASCCHTWQPVCRHRAMICAMTVGEKYPVRIVRGLSRSGLHVQAQAFTDRWIWLDLVDGTVWEVSQDNFQPVEYYTLQEYFAWKWGR